ncbi:MAG TPA: hypothetical protein DC064_08570, partial [Cyanobacteria bacterium UBA9273]|nr:hypothetical protein [Cyanobacteria bacterium UBA9273]
MVMNDQDRSEDIAASNERSLLTLARAITLSQEQFALILVRCNYQVCKQQMWQGLQALIGVPMRQIVLQKSIKTLYTNILAAIALEPTSVLIVFGLESVKTIDSVLISTNQVRDEFRKRFTFPLVLWVTDEVLQKLARFAPDFKSWAATSIKFELTTAELLALWQQTTDELFAAILDTDLKQFFSPDQFFSNDALDLAPGCRRRQELESALRDLAARGVRLESSQNATWQFLIGRDAYSKDQIDIALEQYQQSLEFWQQQVNREGETCTPSYLEQVGILLHHIGWCYCRQAQLQPLYRYENWEKAKDFFSEGIEVFTTAGRLDWVAHLRIQLGEVLQNLQSWIDLQALALDTLAESQSANTSVQLPQAYGFLAAVAQAQSDWEDAKVLAETALDCLEQSGLHQPQHQGWYLLILAKAQRQLGQTAGAIANLEKALKVEGLLPQFPDQSPQLYIDILAELRSLYFHKQQYLRAFEVKQEQRAIEQQYGFFTFLGAAPLQQFTRQGRRISPLEIAAVGRVEEVNRLIEHLSRNDHKLTVIHGASGVGKSSLINAGLVPTLETRIISAREVVPVVQKVYGDWVSELSKQLNSSLSTFGQDEKEITNNQEPSAKLQAIEKQLRLAADRNLFIVLIFDQFEEFFFVGTHLEQRRQFYDFLGDALNLPFIKVILSIREDYLHYLLECERYSNLNAINNNIFDRQLRYRLGDLSRLEAKTLISTLTRVSQFQLEEPLIDALVEDLADLSGAIRLIELQVVGAQLQAEKITTLTQYQALGTNPKTALVERWLLDTIGDCGSENEETVWQVLFALTNEQGTRPWKTQAELASCQLANIICQMPDVGYNTQLATEKLDLILKILVGAGLLFRIPDEPQDRYQLVHDYLVAPIRYHYQQRSQLNMVTQLERSELELGRVRQQRLRAIAVGMAMAVLAVTALGLGWRAESQRRLAATLSFNDRLSALSASSEALFVSNNQLDALLEGLRAAKRLKQVESKQGLRNSFFQIGSRKFFLPIPDFPFPIPHPSSIPVAPDTSLQVIAALSQALYAVSERNRLEGHTDIVTDVNFSPDGQLIASASRDRTVKLWRPNGALITTLNGHQDSVTSVSFSPNSQLIASSSWDSTVRLWHRDGTLVRTFRLDRGHVYRVSFSPNGKLIAAAVGDGTIQLWTVDGKLLETIPSEQGVVPWVSFSPKGDAIASAGKDRTIKLWTLNGKLLQTLRGHKAKVNCVVFSPDGQLIASASDDGMVKLWNSQGKLLKTFRQHDRWVLRVAFSADSQLIGSTSADHTMKLWDRQGNLLKTFKGHNDTVTSLSFHPRSSLPLIASASYDKTVKLWEFRQQSRLILRGHQGNVRDVTFSPDGKLIATASNDGTVKLWNRVGQLLHTLKGHTERVYSVSFSPDGQLIASASRDGTVRLWHPQGTLIKVLRGHQDWVLSVGFSPDSQRIASASRDGTVKLWTSQGTLIKTLRGHKARVNSLSFSPDGQLLASASDDRTIKLWAGDGTLVRSLLGHNNWVLDVSFSPDSQMLVSASYDNTVKLWNRDGKLQATLKGSTDSVARARFSPTGKILATTSWDNRVQLWRLDDTLIKTWKAEEGRITSVNWSNDGKALVVGTEDKTAIVWNLDLDDLWEKGCNWLQDYLQNNSDLKQSDRELCEGMRDEG